MKGAEMPKWRRRLAVERSFVADYEVLGNAELEAMAEGADLLSSNHDTVLSLDWPHYCSYATEACGGRRGWCYTFAGFHVTPAQARKVALNDVLARRVPHAFANRIATCIMSEVRRGTLPYPNLRYSGSGEISLAHVSAIEDIASRGVRLWGFTKNPQVAEALHRASVPVIFSSDRTTPADHLSIPRSLGIPLAYSSAGVDDLPPPGTVVTFPVHISGRVTEAADHPSLCPKVVEEFLHGDRTPAWCQTRCQRCHLKTAP